MTRARTIDLVWLSAGCGLGVAAIISLFLHHDWVSLLDALSATAALAVWRGRKHAT